MFANLFKPKWRHSSPEVRVRAVRKLRTDRAAHTTILRRLVLDDTSLQVRCAALSRIDDPELLIRVLETESEPDLRRSAGEAIARWLTEQQHRIDPEDWIDQLPNDDIRAALVLCDAPQTLKQQALERVQDQSILFVLALEAATANLRRQAAERIDSLELVESLMRESRSRDKAVHRIAREKLQQQRELEQQQAQAQESRQRLLEHLQQLVNSEDRQHFQVRVELIQRDWENLVNATDTPVETPVEERQAFDTLLQQASRIIAEIAEEQARIQAEQDARRQHLDACNSVASELETLFASSPIETTDTNRLESLLAQADELRQQADLPEQLASGYSSAQQLHQALIRLNAQRDALEALLSDDRNDTARAIRKQLSELAWPQAFATPAVVQGANQRLKQIQSSKQAQQEASDTVNKQLAQELDALQQTIDQGETREAGQHHERASELMQQLGGHAEAALEQQYKALTAQLQEIRNWQGFVVNDKKERLCERMEALIDSDLEPRLLANQIRALQQEWKQVDATSQTHSQRLWQRFRGAAETAYAPCEAHFSAQRELRANNLKQREEICRQLEQYLEQIDWDDMDWPAAERICHTAKREWKGFAPVDRAPGKVVQQRFNQLIKTLDQHLRDWHQRCAEQKQQLVDQAAELADAEDIDAAANAAKTLQRQWKSIGPGFRSQERALWQAFREHCDRIFARLKQERKSQPVLELEHADPLLNNTQRQAFDAAIELLDSAEVTLLEGDADEQLPALLTTVGDRVHDLPAPWSEQMRQRLAQSEQILEEPDRLDECLRQSDYQLRELCIRLEILLGCSSPEEDQAHRMEYQMHRLQQALAEQNREASSQDIESLTLEWQTVPFNTAFTSLRQRFDSLLQRTGF